MINDAAESGQALMGATMRLNANVNEGETIRLRPLPLKPCSASASNHWLATSMTKPSTQLSAA